MVIFLGDGLLLLYHPDILSLLSIGCIYGLYQLSILLVVSNMFYFPYIGNVIIPIDFHIFQRGRVKNHQPAMIYGIFIPTFMALSIGCIVVSMVYTLTISIIYGILIPKKSGMCTMCTSIHPSQHHSLFAPGWSAPASGGVVTPLSALVALPMSLTWLCGCAMGRGGGWCPKNRGWM